MTTTSRGKCGWPASSMLVLIAGLFLLGNGPPEPGLEYEIKAEFIERFTHFIEWPPELFPSKDTAFVVCAAGYSPLRTELENVVTRGLKEHPGRLRQVRRDDDVDGCHILYIAPSERNSLNKILARTRDKPILSIGDTAGFAEQGVIINMYVDDSAYVRLEINTDSARVSRLKISSKLMSLAKLKTTRR